MSDAQDDKDRGFTVVDRRAGAAGSDDEDARQQAEDAGSLPRVDFSSFCLSLATSALYHLGVVGDPETGEPAEQKNLRLAQQTIDALDMLREKTRGNLDDEETKLLDGLLYELRVRFVEAGKGAAE